MPLLLLLLFIELLPEKYARAFGLFRSQFAQAPPPQKKE